MKRNSSDIESSSPISSQSDDFKPDITPPPTSKAKNNKTEAPSTPSPKKKAKSSSGGSSSGGGGNGEWTPEKKAIFMDRVIAAGYKVLDLGELATELGMSKQQMKNQLSQGRRGTFREKAVLAVKGSGGA